MLPWYLDAVGQNFWSVTPENIFKWGHFETHKGRYQGAMNVLKQQYLPLAKKYNMELIRGHAIEWGVGYKDCVGTKGKHCFWPVENFDCAKYAVVRWESGKDPATEMHFQPLEVPLVQRAGDVYTCHPSAQIPLVGTLVVQHTHLLHESTSSFIMSCHQQCIVAQSSWNIKRPTGLLRATYICYTF